MFWDGVPLFMGTTIYPGCCVYCKLEESFLKQSPLPPRRAEPLPSLCSHLTFPDNKSRYGTGGCRAAGKNYYRGLSDTEADMREILHVPALMGYQTCRTLPDLVSSCSLQVLETDPSKQILDWTPQVFVLVRTFI